MGMTTVEKIVSYKVGRRVEVGEAVWLEVDLVVARDFGGPNAVKTFEEAGAPMKHPERVAFTFDLEAPARSEAYAQNHKALRDFCKKHGVEKLLDVNRGVGQHALLESGLVAPGDVVLGTDSHMNLLGAVGALALGVGDTDVAAAWICGGSWIKVPPTAKLVLEGSLREGTTAKDLALTLLSKMGDDLMGMAVELHGTGAEGLSMSGRITLCSMATEMGSEIAFGPLDEGLSRFLEEMGLGGDATSKAAKLRPDPEAKYQLEETVRLEELCPMIAMPGSPRHAVPVEVVEGTPIDQVHIGSCTNGSFEDIRAAHQLLLRGGGRIKPGLRCIVTPATLGVALRMAESGITADLIRGGVVVTNPSCSLCTARHFGVLASGERCISTSNRNFDGKVGRGAEVFLASPLTAMASAITGEITDPRKFLRR